jgi:hypothetical protein
MSSPLPPRSRLATAWSIISYIGFIVLFFGIILVPAYMSGWRFGSWLREVISIVWPLPAFFALFAVAIAHDSRKRGDYQDGYVWMFRATMSCLLSLFLLWVTVRHQL